MGTQVLEAVIESNHGLGPTGHATLTKEQRNLLNRLNDFEAPYLEEKLLKKGVFSSSEEYRHAFAEFKKYAALGQISDRPLGMASPLVDEVWHQFILFTRQYGSFCDDVLGEFLHHSPHTSRTSSSEKREGIANFARAYRQVFGEIPKIWNISRSNPSDCSADMCGADECSGCGNQCSKCSSQCK